MSEKNTVRVRTGVIVDADGEWYAIGWNDGTPSDDGCVVAALLHDFTPTEPRAIHFVEADIPIPSPITVEGEVAP